MSRSIAPELRFWPKVRQEGECWIWTASADKNGYGHFYPTRKQTVAAHRWSYEYLRAEIPEGLQLDHLCRKPSCVNPWHLDPVPPKVNVHRGFSWASENAHKTHCDKGHELAGDNLRVNKVGARVCMECRRANARLHYHRKKAV